MSYWRCFFLILLKSRIRKRFMTLYALFFLDDRLGYVAQVQFVLN
jgi:hypothetical protein